MNILSVKKCLSDDCTIHLKTFKGADVQLKQFIKLLVFFLFLNWISGYHQLSKICIRITLSTDWPQSALRVFIINQFSSVDGTQYFVWWNQTVCIKQFILSMVQNMKQDYILHWLTIKGVESIFIKLMVHKILLHKMKLFQ